MTNPAEHTFTLIMNPGRSGSTYLHRLFRENGAELGEFYHEAMHSDVSLPRLNARAYDATSAERVASQPAIRSWLDRWANALRTGSVVEFGWTASHLAPVLHHVFGARLRVVLLHRHPVHVAASRATMGNYRSWYESNTHELNPSDPRALYPQYVARWPSMRPFERCLYWWLEDIAAALEYIERNPDVPHMIVGAEQIFADDRTLAGLWQHCGLPPRPLRRPRRHARNATEARMREAYPIRDDWRRYHRHPEVVALARRLGYAFDDVELERTMKQYQLPRRPSSILRAATRFWVLRRHAGRTLRRAGLLPSRRA